MEITLDKLGRVVIPLAIRKKFNLQPGTVLEITLEEGDKIVLKVVEEKPRIKRKDGVMVIGGDLSEKISF